MDVSVDADVHQRDSARTILMSIVLIVCGVLALSFSFSAAIGIELLLSWLTIFGGVAHLVMTFDHRREKRAVWRAIIGILYIAGGVVLLLHPVPVVFSLTLVLGALFIVEGFLEGFCYFHIRLRAGSGWLLFDAIASMTLGLLVLLSWPDSALWVIGLFAGINFLLSGFTTLMGMLARQRDMGCRLMRSSSLTPY